MARFTCNFISYTLSRTVDITVVVPSVTMPDVGGPDPERRSHAVKEKYPVVYLLHGYGNNHATWCGYTNVEFFAEERNIAVVMISAENKGYVDRGPEDMYYEFIEHELQEFVTSYFPVSTRPEDTYIAGLSMGGGGAMIHGLANPEKYAAIGCFSAGIISTPERKKAITDERFDSELSAEKLKEKGITKKIYLGCGDKDGGYERCQMSRDKLIDCGQDVTWRSFPGYAHEWRVWNLMIEEFLDWLPRTDGLRPENGRKPI